MTTNTEPVTADVALRSLQTGRALKLARAESVLRHQHHKAHVMWALVELETAQEALEADQAKAAWLAIWIENTGKTTFDDDE